MGLLAEVTARSDDLKGDEEFITIKILVETVSGLISFVEARNELRRNSDKVS